MTNKQPVYVLPENTERAIGKDAQRNNILAARIVADIVKSTLGPKGMDKMLVDSLGDVTITNDGVTILEKMEVEHPAAKMLVEISKTQEEEVGDGTTTAVMLAGKLLENAEKLLDMKIHPTIITKGYALASEKALEFLEELGIDYSNDDSMLRAVVRTAMTGKGAEISKDRFAEIIIRTVQKIREEESIDLDNVKFVKNKSNSVSDTELIEGVVIDKERVSVEMPRRIENARIALLSEELETKSLDDAKISISSPEQLERFIEREEKILKEIVEKIKSVNANVVFCQRGIDDTVQFYLAKEGIYACRRVAKTDMESLAKATGAKIINNLNELSEAELGYAEVVEEVKHGEEAMTYVRGCKNPKTVSILIYGGSDYVMDEIERSIKDGLGDIAAVLKHKKVVPGAGAIEIELAKRLREFSNSLPGREQLAVQEFANALEFIPSTLAENAGLDPIDILTELKSRHEKGEFNVGINLLTEKIEDVVEKGILEPLNVKKKAISSATEVAIMILRIDDVLASKPEKSSSGKLDYTE